MKFTILGGRGFIGTSLADYLSQAGHDVLVPKRDLSDIDTQSAGHVIYAIGLTGDFRTRPFDTVDAHVTLLADLLQRTRFESWLYLSSTRLYGFGQREDLVTEESEICLRPSADTLYDLSKLLGESLCMVHPDESVRVARLSNVVGVGQSSATFLGSILKELRLGKNPIVQETPESTKDYICVRDVAHALTLIATTGQQRIYNVASGLQTTHTEIGKIIRSESGKSISFAADGPTRVFPDISTERLRREFPAFKPRAIDEFLGDALSRIEI